MKELSDFDKGRLAALEALKKWAAERSDLFGDRAYETDDNEEAFFFDGQAEAYSDVVVYVSAVQHGIKKEARQ